MLRKRFKNNGKSILDLNEIQFEMKRQIDLKVKQEIYQFESTSCCICRNQKFIRLSNKDRYGLYMSVVICPQCGLIQTNPRMTQEAYKNFYNNEYRKLYVGVKEANKLFFLNQKNIGRKIYSYMLRNSSITKSPSDLFVIEVGCGAGGILQYFKEKGCQILGLDLGKEYIEFGKKNYGLDLVVGTIANISIDKTPDIIIYNHVLEHILSIKEELNNIHRLLSDDGVLYIRVPGVKNLYGYYFDFLQFLQNAHVYHFTMLTLRNLLEIHGFQMIVGDETVRGIFRKSIHSNSNKSIRNDFKAVILYLNRIEHLKKLYYFKHDLNEIIQIFLSLDIGRLKETIIKWIKGFLKK